MNTLETSLRIKELNLGDAHHTIQEAISEAVGATVGTVLIVFPLTSGPALIRCRSNIDSEGTIDILREAIKILERSEDNHQPSQN